MLQWLTLCVVMLFQIQSMAHNPTTIREWRIHRRCWYIKWNGRERRVKEGVCLRKVTKWSYTAMYVCSAVVKEVDNIVSSPSTTSRLFMFGEALNCGQKKWVRSKSVKAKSIYKIMCVRLACLCKCTCDDIYTCSYKNARSRCWHMSQSEHLKIAIIFVLKVIEHIIVSIHLQFKS